MYGVDKSIGLTSQPRYQSDNLSRYKLIDQGMFAYNPMRLNIGSIGFCSESREPGIVSPDYVVFECNPAQLLPEFFDYHTQSYDWASWLSLSGEGSVRERIYFKKLALYEFILPPLSHQRATVTILSSLDKKIKNNLMLNETLLETALAIFRDWFVDFGPVRRQMAGTAEPTAILGSMIEDPAHAEGLAAIFSDAIGQNGLPIGWAEQPLLEQAHWVNGAAYKNMHFVDGGVGLPVIKIAELKSGVTAQTRFTNTELGLRYRIQDGELLFSWSGNPDTSIDAFLWAGGDAWLNQHVFSVRENGKRSKADLFILLKSLMPRFTDIARDKQTTGLGHVTKDDMKRMLVTVAPNAVRAAYNQIIEPIVQRIILTLHENRTLNETRDYLLPRLMSGAIEVTETVPGGV